MTPDEAAVLLRTATSLFPSAVNVTVDRVTVEVWATALRDVDYPTARAWLYEYAASHEFLPGPSRIAYLAAESTLPPVEDVWRQCLAWVNAPVYADPARNVPAPGDDSFPARVYRAAGGRALGRMTPDAGIAAVRVAYRAAVDQTVHTPIEGATRAAIDPM